MGLEKIQAIQNTQNQNLRICVFTHPELKKGRICEKKHSLKRSQSEGNQFQSLERLKIHSSGREKADFKDLLVLLVNLLLQGTCGCKEKGRLCWMHLYLASFTWKEWFYIVMEEYWVKVFGGQLLC